eukprot:31502-Pelagococcus_subviridis.AAC.21
MEKYESRRRQLRRRGHHDVARQAAERRGRERAPAREEAEDDDEDSARSHGIDRRQARRPDERAARRRRSHAARTRCGLARARRVDRPRAGPEPALRGGRASVVRDPKGVARVAIRQRHGSLRVQEMRVRVRGVQAVYSRQREGVQKREAVGNVEGLLRRDAARRGEHGGVRRRER